MKISKEQLKKVIKEEIEKEINDNSSQSKIERLFHDLTIAGRDTKNNCSNAKVWIDELDAKSAMIALNNAKRDAELVLFIIGRIEKCFQ